MSNRAVVALLIGLVPVATGCRSAASVRGLSLDEGVRARYALPTDEVTAAVSAAMAESGAGAPEITRPVPDAADPPQETGSAGASTTMLLASTGLTLTSYGSHTRAVVQADDGGGPTDVRALSRSRALTDLSGRADRRARTLLRALDERLGPASIVPYPGMRVRGRTPDGGTLVGTAQRAEDGTWVVGDGPDSVPVRLDGLSDVAASRGSFTHRADWALGLGLAGWVVGLLLPVDDCGRGPLEAYCSVASRLERANLVVGIGVLTGVIVGSLHRTEVWSPMTGGGR